MPFLKNAGNLNIITSLKATSNL